MKLCSISIEKEKHVGVKTEGGIVDLTALGLYSRMDELIAAGDDALARIAGAIDTAGAPLLDEKNIKFLPVTEPKKIICVGLNYKKHAEETGGTAPEHPIFFSKYSDALTATGEPVTLPPWLSWYDYEAELVIVIGKDAFNIPACEADEYIFGYTCGNDLSARDAQFLSSQWLAGKTLPGFAPVGPYIVTRDSFDHRKPNKIYCELNGRTVQSGDTSDMIFPCDVILSTASRFFRLSPGDLIFTGTPAGVVIGKPKDKRVWLKPGDKVKVMIDGIGELFTPLV